MGTGLTEGSHSFTVRVTDHAGNANDTTAWAWHVDLPPTCEVTAEQPATDARALVTKPFDVRVPVHTCIDNAYTRKLHVALHWFGFVWPYRTHTGEIQLLCSA